MNDLLDRRTRRWALVAIVLGSLAMIAIEWIDEPEATALDMRLSG